MENPQWKQLLFGLYAVDGGRRRSQFSLKFANHKGHEGARRLAV